MLSRRVVGATGMVGQRFVSLLDGHPLVSLPQWQLPQKRRETLWGGSERAVGYGQADPQKAAG